MFKMKFNILKKLILLFIITLLFFACKKDYKSGSCESIAGAETILHDGVQREYILYIPTSYDAAQPTALLMNFHGFGGNANDYMHDADMRSTADIGNFILVYPQGTCLDGFPHWNTSLPGGDNKSNADDFGFVEAMINQISSEYNIDKDRIYACGYSNGGMFAYGLANFKSELIAAIASVSGTMVDFDGSTSHPMPVLDLHGTNDGVVPYNGGSDFSSIPSVLDYWINFNNTLTNPETDSSTEGNITIEHYIYGQGDNGVAVEHYKYIGGEHIWFNTPFKNKSTAQLIWEFVSKYDINGKTNRK